MPRHSNTQKHNVPSPPSSGKTPTALRPAPSSSASFADPKDHHGEAGLVDFLTFLPSTRRQSHRPSSRKLRPHRAYIDPCLGAHKLFFNCARLSEYFPSPGASLFAINWNRTNNGAPKRSVDFPQHRAPCIPRQSYLLGRTTVSYTTSDFGFVFCCASFYGVTNSSCCAVLLPSLLPIFLVRLCLN